jgi:hypothetical protein
VTTEVGSSRSGLDPTGVAGDGLVLFADIPGIVRMVPQTTNEAAVLAPLRGIGVGMYTDGNAGVVETLLLVDY